MVGSGSGPLQAYAQQNVNLPIANIHQAGNGNVSAMPNTTWADYDNYMASQDMNSGAYLAAQGWLQQARQLGNQLINPLIGPGGVPINGNTGAVGSSIGGAPPPAPTLMGQIAQSVPMQQSQQPLVGNVSATGGTGGNSTSSATGGNSSSSALVNNNIVMPTNFTPPTMDIPDFTNNPVTFNSLPGFSAPGMIQSSSGPVAFQPQQPVTVNGGGGGSGGSYSKSEERPAAWISPTDDRDRGPGAPLTGGIEKREAATRTAPQVAPTPFMNYGAGAGAMQAAQAAPIGPSSQPGLSAFQAAQLPPGSEVVAQGPGPALVPPPPPYQVDWSKVPENMRTPGKIPTPSQPPPLFYMPPPPGKAAKTSKQESLTKQMDHISGRGPVPIGSPKGTGPVPAVKSETKEQKLLAKIAELQDELAKTTAKKETAYQEQKPQLDESVTNSDPGLRQSQQGGLNQLVGQTEGLLKNTNTFNPRPQEQATPQGRDAMFGDTAKPKPSVYGQSPEQQANRYMLEGQARINSIKQQYQPQRQAAEQQLQIARQTAMQSLQQLRSLPNDDQIRQQAINQARAIVAQQDQEAGGLMNRMGMQWRGQYMKPGSQRVAALYNQYFEQGLQARQQTQQEAQYALQFSNQMMQGATATYNDVISRQNQEINQELTYQKGLFSNQNQYANGASQYDLGTVRNEINKTNGYMQHNDRQDQINSGYALGQGRNAISAFDSATRAQSMINNQVLGNRRLDIAQYGAENQAQDIASRIGQRNWEQLHGDRNDQIRAAVAYNTMLNNSARTDIARGNLGVAQGRLQNDQTRTATAQRVADQQIAFQNWKINMGTGQEVERGIFNAWKMLQADHHLATNDRMEEIRSQLADNQIDQQRAQQEMSQAMFKEKSQQDAIRNEYQKMRDGKTDGFRMWQLMLQTGKDITPWLKKSMSTANPTEAAASFAGQVLDAAIP